MSKEREGKERATLSHYILNGLLTLKSVSLESICISSYMALDLDFRILSIKIFRLISIILSLE